MEMLLIPNNIELIHCEEEAQTIIVILVFLQTHPDIGKQDLFSTMDVDCSCRDNMVAVIQSFSIRHPKYNIERNSYF